MRPETRKALELSIQKWEDIVAGTGQDHGRANCGLCQRFGYVCQIRNEDGVHEFCPVWMATGEDNCCSSPYADWLEANEAHDRFGFLTYEATDDETIMCAVLELEFLKDLLTKEK